MGLYNADMTDLSAALCAFQTELDGINASWPKSCYCESNAADHKGPCGECNQRGMIMGMVIVAYRILAMDAVEFAIECPLYMEQVEDHGWGVWKQRKRIVGDVAKVENMIRECKQDGVWVDSYFVGV